MHLTFAKAKIYEGYSWVYHCIGQSDMNTKLDKSNNFIKSLGNFLSHLDLDKDFKKQCIG